MIMTEAEVRRLRPLAFSVAYRMLGSVVEAEDVTQEALLRVVQAGPLDNPSAFTTTVATRLSLDVLRSARVRRERYVGQWLPEPLVSGAQGDAADAAHHAELADDLSTAFLVLLETLTPTERAAFLLHDVLGYDYGQVADTLRRTEPATRKLVSRARGRVQERRPRFPDVPQRRDRLVARFLDACERGAVDEFVDLLTDDVVFTGDGGGKVPPGLALSKPVAGIGAVTKLLGQFVTRGGFAHLEPRMVNGSPGAAIVVDDAVGGGLLAVVSIEIDGDRISHLRSVINPEKLTHLGRLADLSRIYAFMRAQRG